MTFARQPRVVVGVSGSRASLRALRWAAREASGRRASLEVVAAWQSQEPAFYAVKASRADHGQQQDAAARRLAAILRSVDPELPDSVTTHVVEGPAERVLAERSAGAAMLVLGSSSLPGRSIGPVIRSCLGLAACPIVVVGAEQGASDDPPRDEGRHAGVAGLRGVDAMSRFDPSQVLVPAPPRSDSDHKAPLAGPNGTAGERSRRRRM